MSNKAHKNKSGKSRNFIALILMFILYILISSIFWGSNHFGNISMDEIIFTLNMPLEGSGSDFITDYIVHVLLPAIIIFIVLSIDIFRKKKRTYKIQFNKKIFNIYPCNINIPVLILITILGLTGILKIADDKFSTIEFAKNQFSQSSFIEDNYVSPTDVNLDFPEKKRNLIYILLESGESSAQDIDNGGLFDVNYIPEMTELAKNNVSFSQSDKIEGAAVAPACGWTMAGMVAEFSGLPLKLYKYDDTSVDNSMGNYQEFLPGVTNLGDILEKEGYKNYYMIGSDVRFSGRDKYMSQHGNYEIWDYYTAIEKEKIPEDYYVWWGYEDMRLYDYAKEELTRISQNDEPFNFTMLTVDTHHIGGYVCPLCQNEHSEQYGNVWSCASRQVNDFVNWIKEQPFYENTTIVICGDHCSMDPEFYSDFAYDKHHGEVTRKVYNAIINPAVKPVNEKNREFVTMDMFPTTLAAMGVEIEGNRLGLGTNLFSEEETLSEEYGYEDMFNELNKKSNYYDETFLFSKK